MTKYLVRQNRTAYQTREVEVEIDDSEVSNDYDLDLAIADALSESEESWETVSAYSDIESQEVVNPTVDEAGMTAHDYFMSDIAYDSARERGHL